MAIFEEQGTLSACAKEIYERWKPRPQVYFEMFHAEVILEAEPDHERAKVFRLRFAMLRIRHATNPVQNHVETPNAAEKRIQNLLYGIFIVLVLILIELWRR